MDKEKLLESLHSPNKLTYAILVLVFLFMVILFYLVFSGRSVTLAGMDFAINEPELINSKIHVSSGNSRRKPMSIEECKSGAKKALVDLGYSIASVQRNTVWAQYPTRGTKGWFHVGCEKMNHADSLVIMDIFIAGFDDDVSARYDDFADTYTRKIESVPWSEIEPSSEFSSLTVSNLFFIGKYIDECVNIGRSVFNKLKLLNLDYQGNILFGNFFEASGASATLSVQCTGGAAGLTVLSINVSGSTNHTDKVEEVIKLYREKATLERLDEYLSSPRKPEVPDL